MGAATLPAPSLPFPSKSVRFAADSGAFLDEEIDEFIQITVLGVCGDEIAVVHATDNCTVASLKAAIAAQSSVPTAGQALILDSFILENDGETMSEVLEACGCTGQVDVTMMLVVIPVDPFPKLYVDACGVQVTARRAEQTPKAEDWEDFDFLGGVEFPWALTCKECDGSLHEKSREYDFATPCKKASYLKVSASMWCPACRLIFQGLHKVPM